AHVGQHLCFVTNRIKVPVPAHPSNPPAMDTIQSMGQQLGTAALNALGGGLSDTLRFGNFANSIASIKDVSVQAASLVDFLADNYAPGTISAVIHFVLNKILPVGERVDTNLTEVIGWTSNIRSFCVEAAFPLPLAITFVAQVFALVNGFAVRRPAA